MGPLGTGLLYIREELAEQIDPLRKGGTGTQSELATQPKSLPEKFESGNSNVPGLIGLDAGVQYVLDNDLPSSKHLLNLTERLIAGLRKTDAVTLYSKPNHYGIVSFNVENFDPRELATALDSMASIQVRAGLHCAPMMHESIGTFERGGTCLLYTSPSPRDATLSRMPSSA